MMENEEYYVWFSLLKKQNKRKLLSEYDNLKDLYNDISYSEKESDIIKVYQILEKCKKNNIKILPYNQFEKINLFNGLEHITTKPFVLYYKGNIVNKKKKVAVVGARRCSQYGKSLALELTEKMVNEETAVISGMAKGIDSYAHTKTLLLNGYTVAVFGCGIDICYPREHDRLMEKIVEKGIVLSEYPPGTPPNRYNFPNRNRIIAALSDEIYVIDAGKGSGALITADYGAKYGRKVYFY